MKYDLRKYYDGLLNSELFTGLDRENLRAVLELTHARLKNLKKNEIIYHYGDDVREVGIVLDGFVVAEANNAEGEKTNLSMVMPGEEFGAFLILSGETRSTMQVYAGARSVVVFLDMTALVQETSHSPEALKVMDNLLHSFAKKLLDRHRRLHIYGQKRIRSRVRMHLLMLDRVGDEVLVPMSRTEWADYLGVDRTALARELGRMRDEGLISLDKRRVRLLDKAFFNLPEVE